MPDAEFCINCGKRFGIRERYCTDCGERRPTEEEQRAALSRRLAEARSDDAARVYRPGIEEREQDEDKGNLDGRSGWSQYSGQKDVFGREAREPGAFPTAVAQPALRGVAWLLSYGVPTVALSVRVDLASAALTAIMVIVLVWAAANWILYRRGKDLGTHILGMRVIRDNGDLPGFYHMWARNFASILSLLPLGIGFFWAFGDQKRQTWHDKLMGTYVVQDSEAYRDLPGTSSDTAKAWFWITLLLFIVAPTLLGILGIVSTLPQEGG